ncbi:major facilitator superfamily domain-containing protein [Phyllosticta capitalensis]|uniref:Major facilitator superfamily domain-containing protein n=2 Tax=Phyllosticta capitalensis TaxID=121624 RepID=A0ABR1YQH1_9PEZI
MSQLGSARNSFNAALNRNDSQKSAGLSELTTLKSASETPPEDFKPGWRFLFAFICLCIVNLVCALDATSISVALPVMSEALHGTGIEAFWTGTSFLLTATVFQPSFASLSHVFGRKPLLLIALTFFTVGAIAGAVSNDFTALLTSRVIQGIGGGGIAALTGVIITDMVPLKERGKWLGLVTMMWAIGSVIGPVIGGVLAEKASWRWIFWINVPFCAIGYVMIPLFLKLQYKPGNFMQKLKQIDWIGSFLFVASTTSTLIPITWGGVMYPWDHWRTLVPLCVGVSGLCVFIVYSKYIPKEPILRGTLFKNVTALVCYVSIVIHGMMLWSALYYMPLYFQAAKSMSPTTSGIALFPWTFTTAPAAVVAGILIAKTGRYRWAMYFGWFTTTVGSGLLILYKEHTPAKEWIPLALISGMGLGFLYPAMSLCNQAAAVKGDVAAAAALNPFFRNFGQTLGVAVGGTVVQNQVKKQLLASAIPAVAAKAAEYSKDATTLVSVVNAMRGDPSMAAVRHDLIEAYITALHVLWIVMCSLGALAGVLTILFVKAYSMDRELETDQGFVDNRPARDEMREVEESSASASASASA